VAAEDQALVLVTTTSDAWAAAELHRIRAWERRILASQAAVS